MIPNSEEENTFFDFIGVFILLVIIACIIWYALNKHTEMLTSNNFTIGTITGRGTDDSGHYCEYQFEINGKWYCRQSVGCYQGCECQIFGRYYVTFISNDPSDNLMHLDKPVPDSIKQAPLNGWLGNLDSLYKINKLPK
jgi:hypothetical protein